MRIPDFPELWRLWPSPASRSPWPQPRPRRHKTTSPRTRPRAPGWTPARAPTSGASLLLQASSQEQKLRWLDEQSATRSTETTFSGVTYAEQLPCTQVITYTDGPDGVRGSTGVTAFPAPIALAATWNSELSRAKGKAQAQEAFDKGRVVVLAPGIASGRTPLSGRNYEYYGEDFLLSGRTAGADIRGLQQGDPGKPTLAVVKRYVANEQELDRMLSSSNVDERTLCQVYVLPFEVAISDGRPGKVMCSYNQINSGYACENPILRNILKNTFGFDGFVMSDFGAVHSTAPSLRAGLDQELNRPIHFTPEKTPQQYPGTFADGGTTRPPGEQTNIRQVAYTEGLKVGYKWYDSQNITPLFPFGHGLSYTTHAA